MCVVGESSLEESLHQHLPVVKLQLLMKPEEEFDHGVSCGRNPATCIHREDYSSARSPLKDEIRSFPIDRANLNFVEVRQEGERQKLLSSRGRCLAGWEENLGLTAAAVSAQVWRPEGGVGSPVLPTPWKWDSSPWNHEMCFKAAEGGFCISTPCSSGSLALRIEVFVPELRLKTYCF